MWGNYPRFFSIATDKMSEADEAAIKRGLAGVIVKAEPTRTVSDRYLFRLGDEHFEVLALPGGETLDSLALFTPAFTPKSASATSVRPAPTRPANPRISPLPIEKETVCCG